MRCLQRARLFAGHHRAQTRSGWRHAQAQEAQAGLGQSGHCQQQQTVGKQRWHQVRQQLPPQQSAVTHAGRARGGDELQFGQAQRAGPRDAGHRRHEHDAQRDDDLQQRLTRIGDHRDHQHQRRKRQQDRHRRHDRPLDPPAKVTGDDAQRTPCHQPQAHRAQAHQQGDAKAVQRAREHVAAERVGAEPAARCGRSQHVGQRLLQWVGDRQPACRDRRRQHQREPGERELVAGGRAHHFSDRRGSGADRPACRRGRSPD